jgi:hypothetical protein
VSIDPNTLIGSVATVTAAGLAGWLAVIGNRGRRQSQNPSDGGVSLTKVIDDRVADLKQRIDELEAETRQLRDERDTARAGREQLLHENEFLGIRNKEIEGFNDPNH